ncbi:MAG: hypothetical protein ACLSCW_08190 [Gemmiger formicilis]
MLYHKYKPLASRVYCAGLALLLMLSEVFSSNVQDTLPGFSRIMRLGLTGCAVLLLAGKIILLTGYEARWQKVLIAVVLVYTAFSSWYGGDLWFFLAALVGLGAKDVDWETALRVYLVTAVAGLVLVQALHFATPLMPYKFYCRNWDFGYGHYNGFGARLVGVFLPGRGCGMTGYEPLTGRGWPRWPSSPTRFPAAAGRSAAWRCCLCCSLCKNFCRDCSTAKSFTGWRWRCPSRWQCSVSTPGMSTTPSGPMSGWRCCC